jgi:hypothetical protein
MPRDGSRKSFVPRDLPALPQGKLPDDIRQPLEAIREAVQSLLGLRGDGRDAALTSRSATALGILTAGGSFAGGGTGTGGTGGTTPDLTPPPNVTGLSASAGLSHIIVTWDAALYSVGHGHKQTNLYAVKKLASDATLPTFADAQLYESETGALTIASLPSDLAIRWHIWAKYETQDGIESTSPAGGLHGVVAQTGLINGVDLAPLLIEADKLSQGTFPGLNLIANAGAEDFDPVTLAPKAWMDVESFGTFSITSDATTFASGSRAFRLARATPGAHAAVVGSTAFPVIPGETYSVKVRARGGAASSAGMYIRIFEKDSKPATLTIAQANMTSFTDLRSNGSIPAVWTAYEFQYTVPAGIFWCSFSMYHYQTSTISDMWFDEAEFGRQITASKIAAGAIAVGTAAIQNGAIVNAMIGTAAVDDAKIANLSAAKLTVGTGVVGGPLKSTNYVSGTSGWIVLPSGFAEFNDVEIRNAVYTGQIFAGSGTIGGIVINTTDLHSSGFVAGSSGFRLKSDGTAEFQSLTARGNIEATSLNAATGTFTGSLSAATGTFAGSLSAATGSFAGSLSAATGSFAGSLSAATGTFAGTLTAGALVVAGQSLFLPAYAQSSAHTSSPATGETTLLTLASVDPGATGSVAIVVTAEFYATGSLGGEGDTTGPFIPPQFAIYRGSTQIALWQPPSDANASRGTTARTVLDVPGGAAVYTLRLTAGGQGSAERRTMLAMGVVR